jgi:hypothetical protein
LEKRHDVNGTKETPMKEFTPHDIDTGDSRHQQYPSKPYPLKPAT